MHEDALQSYCPAFGLLPDIAAFATHPPFGEPSPPPAHHWVWKAPPADVDAVHEPGFVFNILRRIQAQLDRPVLVSHTRHDKKACVAKLTRPARFSAGYTMLRHSVVGNHLWTLIKCPDDRVIVGLDLMAGGGKQGMGWGHKGMDEEFGPYSYDCPLSFLDAASEPRGSAIEWRRAVRAHHANKKISRPYISQVVSFGSEQYLLMGPTGPHRGWLVHRVSDGAALRMNSKQLARSEVV